MTTSRIFRTAAVLGLNVMVLFAARTAAEDTPRPGPTLEDGRPQGLPLDADGREKYNAGWTVAIDNDILSLTDRDYDYTGGAAVTLTGRRAEEWLLTLDPVLGGLEFLVPGRHAAPGYFTLHAVQFGALAFTPDDLNATEPIRDDRPYASLVFLSSGRTYVKDPRKPVYQTSFTAGVLGLDIVGDIQHWLHEELDLDEVPEGWDFQISDGGEPTVQMNWSRQVLLASNFQSRKTEYELKWGADASVGTVTEGTASVSLRWGKINTPWWSFTPERAEYLSRPAPVVGGSVRPGVRELYVWGGLKAHARAYNVYLQGQFRESEVTFDAGELDHLIGEAWLGVTWQVSREYRLGYVARYQTGEIEAGAGSRSVIWAGFLISRDL
jgi:Uncharacterized protein conserved in bacteria (DUF2219)